MNKMYTALLALAAFALLVPAQATAPCYTTSTPQASIPDVTGQVGGDIYVVNDLCQPVVGDGSCIQSDWVYEESNGISGLQRGDEVQNDVANCTDGTAPDTDIF